MKIYIVGIGMDGSETLTERAREVIRSADVLIGAARMLKPFEYLKKTSFVSWDAEEIRTWIERRNDETIAILMSGDCGFFSGAERLIGAFKEYDAEILCGISSPVYFCSKIKIPWQNMKFISLHGTSANIIRNICRNQYCFFLLGGEFTPADICARMCEYGLGERRVFIGENLSLDQEKILIGNALDFTKIKCEKLCVAVVENDDYERGILSGISDSDFIRGNVPMTKSEVRSVAISKLGIGSNDICWDIGCGTGSVSVEMALQCYDGAVFSVDGNDSAVALTEKNRLKFGCDNIRLLCGTAPDCLTEFPAPDKVFIGGGSEKISEIAKAAYRKNPNARIVATAVSLETLESSLNAFKGLHITPEIVQVAVTRTKQAGSHTMLAAENPVFIIRGAGR